MFKTIKSKFIFTTLILIVISVGIPTYFLINQFKKNFEQRSAVMVKSALDIVMHGIYDKMRTTDHKDVQKIIFEISQNPSVDHIRIIDKEATVLFSSDSMEIGQNLNRINPNHLTNNLSDSMRFTRISDEGVWSAVQPINNTIDCQQCHSKDRNLGYVDIDTKLTQAESYFYTGSLHIYFLAALITVILFIIFFVVFNRLINNPLQIFIKTMKQVETGNLDVSLPAEKNDEIGQLENKFNSMIKQLKKSQNQIEEMHFDQLRHADKLVTLGELAAEMAHEINNPAGIIMTRADYLQLEADNNLNLEKYKEDFDVIVGQTQRVSKITQNILKYSKKLPKDFNKVDLIKIVNESTKILEPRIEKYKIKVIKDMRLNNAFIFGDPIQIEQVITNLVNNSIDAIQNNGELKIKVDKTENQEIQLSIEDNGPGIEDHIKEKIFSPFFTTKKGNKGTGLGLYIVKNICNNHNAEIECISVVKKRTIFKITFKGVKSI